PFRVRSMMRTCLFLLVVALAPPARAQDALGSDGGNATLTAHMRALAQATSPEEQDRASESVKTILRKMLEADDAFTHTFAGVPLSRVDAADSKFRLFTWNLPRPDGSHSFEGLLLVQDRKRRVVYELRDMTEKITSPELPELGADNWYGALYYDVVAVTKGGKIYYTLLGWKGFSRTETRKVIEVLSFRGSEPRFGAGLFATPPAVDAPSRPAASKIKPNRRVFGYSFQVSMSLKLDPSEQRIVFDHLSPTKPELAGQPAFNGPDLSYDAYRWEKGQWLFQRDVDARDLDMTKPWNAPPKDGRSKF
nr:hypothetical protein [Flavobacteriales bacterium]